jgi:hypothetical protein
MRHLVAWWRRWRNRRRALVIGPSPYTVIDYRAKCLSMWNGEGR